MTEYHAWGSELPSQDIDKAPEPLKKLAQLCKSHTACDVIGFVYNETNEQFGLILDIGDGAFAADNGPGILREERILVIYNPTGRLPWDARPLRCDFPVTMHQNHVHSGEPPSLCLYIESWKEIERTWTPESFIRRILWWLKATAEGTIHADDQPIEQLFFDSPVTVLLPSDHEEKLKNEDYRLVFDAAKPEGSTRTTLIGQYISLKDIDEGATPICHPISLFLNEVENGPIEHYPNTLGELDDLVSARGSNLRESLEKAIKERVTRDGLEEDSASAKIFILLLVVIPRTRDKEFERFEQLGFCLKGNVCQLGEALGVLCKSPDTKLWHVDTLIPGFSHTSNNWKSKQINICHVQEFPQAQNVRSYSGLSPEDKGPRGTIAGVGALGSSIAQLWAREEWGEWSYVDSDILEVHNLVRHTGIRRQVGFTKASAVRLATDCIYERNTHKSTPDYVGSILDDSPTLNSILEQSDVLVDVTTTLHVPRDLSERDDAPRIASLFMTPSGNASVMLLEDAERFIRSNFLEAQYYRGLLRSDWGKHHLDGHQGKFWVGAGCRDQSTTLSNEVVQLHGATLARQLRKSLSNESAKICIWECNDEDGSIAAHSIPVDSVRSVQLGTWNVFWGHSFETSIRNEREANLPNETGGMLLGIVDQKSKTITMVDWVVAPEDSDGTPHSFVRGINGQKEALQECERRTAGIVGYVGEWHSHPAGHSAQASDADRALLTSLSDTFMGSGVPVIMVIVSEGSVGFTIKVKQEFESEIVNFHDH